MRKELGVLLMEDQSGEVAVQLFAETASAEKAFADLKGSPADPTRRATFVTLRYDESNTVRVASFSRMLPVIEPVDDRPDGYVLGQGPVRFPKDDAVSGQVSGNDGTNTKGGQDGDSTR